VDHNPILPISAALLVVILLALLFFLPPFSGINATILFFSSILSRTLLHPYESDLIIGMNSGFVFFTLRLILFVILFYFLIHIRYRHLLSPYLEPYAVSPVAFGVSILLAFLLLVAASLPSMTTIIGNEWLEFAGSQPELLIVASFSWLLTAMMIYYDLYRKKERVFGQFLVFLSLISLTALSSVIITRSFPDTKYGTGVIISDGIAANLISFPAYLFDKDRDGNSFWPGGDPDDGNGCIRLDYICNPGGLRDDANRVAHAESGRKNMVLVTISARAKLTDATLLAADDTSHLLRALLRNLNGMQEYEGIDRRSVFSILSDAGYRTICGGYDGQKGYLETAGGFGLDSGCQIFIGSRSLIKMMEPPSGENVAFRDTVRVMRSVRKKYSEKRNLIWIHHESDHEATEEFFLERAVDTLSEEGILSPGDALFVLITNPPFGTLYGPKRDMEGNHLSRIRRSSNNLTEAILKEAALPESMNPYSAGPTVLYRDPLAIPAAGRFAKRLLPPSKFPERTIIMNGDIPYIRDHIHGIHIPLRKNGRTGEADRT
jgi:hypothetical protein